MARRRFLLGSGAALLLVACSDDDASSVGSESTSDAGGTAASTTTAAGASGETTDDTTTSTGTDPATSEAAGAGAVTDLTPADFAGLATCVVLPELTAGPFPLEEQFDRRDITEGYPGHPMRLGLRVVDAACTPVAGAAVEVWHSDATGDYSAFADNGGGKDEGSGTTFLRGTQTADDDGIVEFLTVYPGWYRGRAVHIHLRVHLDDATVLTSQMFFDEDYTASVYDAAPYDEFGLPDTSNAQDGIAGNPAREGTRLVTAAAATTAGAGTLALLNIGIDPGGAGPGGA